MQIFYFVTDTFPAWRVDLIELFGRQLQRLGISTTWQMRRRDRGWCDQATQEQQKVYLPPAWPGHGALSAVVRRLGEWFCEAGIFLRLVFGRRYDIIQVRDDRYTAALLAWLAARLRGAKFTYWVSFPFPENDLEMAERTHGIRRLFLKFRGRISFWWLYLVMLPKADHVFVQSEQMKADMAAYGLAPEKMTPVPMGVADTLLQFNQWRATESIPGKIVYLGTLTETRRLDTIIRAFAQITDTFAHAQLVMVGEGVHPHERLTLESLCAQLGIRDKVRFTGFIPMEQAWHEAANAEICLSPFYPTKILNSTSPTKISEYLALGRAVIANNHPEQNSIISESGAGLCVAWGEEYFAQAMSTLLQQPELTQQLGSRGPDWVAGNRTYTKIASGVYTVYERLLKQMPEQAS